MELTPELSGSLVQPAQDLLHQGKLEEARSIFDRFDPVR
jgi:hypothetical protein